MRRVLVPALLLLTLTGCVPTPPEPSPSATPSSTPTASTPSPTATAEATALVIPGCETLLPIATARALFSESTEFLGELTPAELTGRIAGEPTVAALAAAGGQSLACLWGVPNSDGVFVATVGEVTPEQRGDLAIALAAAGFADTMVGPARSFDAEQEGEVSLEAGTHRFLGSAWVAVHGTSLGSTQGIAQAVLDAVIAANPALTP